MFPTRGLLKHEGAGVYFHVSPDEVWIGGGMYAPEAPQLHAVREHIAANVRKLRAIVESPGFRKQLGTLEGEKLKRVPRGFPGSSGRRVSEVPPVPGRRRVSRLARHEPEVLRHAARRLSRGHAAHPLSERAAAERLMWASATTPDDLDALVVELNAGVPPETRARERLTMDTPATSPT